MLKHLLLLVLAATSLAANADLTNGQLTTLRNYINSVPALAAQPLNSDGDFFIANELNKVGSPVCVVWRSSVPAEEYRDAIVWTELTARSAGERDMFSFLTAGGSMDLNMAKPNVRQAVNDAFSGAGGLNTRNALRALGQRNATTFEKLYTGGGTCDAANPSNANVEGPVSPATVATARAG